MAIKFNRSQTFATGGTVTSAALHNLVDGTDIYSALITDQSDLSTVSTADKLLIADTDDSVNAKSTTVFNLFDDALSGGTYSNAYISGQFSYGTATGTRLVSTNATITTGTIPTATLGTTTGTAATFTSGTLTTGVIPTGTLGTTTSTAATITNGTVTNLNSTSGTVATLNSTTGTIATLNSTTGTITNLSTTLAGDFTISGGTGTLGTTGVTAGSYGTNTEAVTLTIDAKGRVTTVSTSAISTTPANGSVTPAMLSQPLTLGTAVTSTSGTAVDFTGIPSWVRRITVIIYRVSTTGGSLPTLRLGTSGGIVSSGYECNGGYGGAGTANATSTDGFVLNNTANFGAASSLSGLVILSNVTGNNWACAFSFGLPFHHSGGGSVSLSGALDRLRLTTEGGTETFDAGSVNIMYEG